MNARRRWPGLIVLPLLLLAGPGCEPADEEGEMETPAEEPLPESEVGPIVADTTAEAIWAYLQQENYQDTWAHWPEKEPYYEGTEPHGVLLSTYLNTSAGTGLEAMRTRPEVDDLPFGSMVVKENFAPDSTLAAVTVMYKVEQYDPEHHDWFWMKRLADGTVEAAGRVQGCIDCHADAAETWDYLMTGRSQWGPRSMDR